MSALSIRRRYRDVRVDGSEFRYNRFHIVPGFRGEVVVQHVAVVVSLVTRRLPTVVFLTNYDADSPALHLPGVTQQPVGIVNFDAQSLREEIPVGATFFHEPDCLTELVITRHLVPG